MHQLHYLYRTLVFIRVYSIKTELKEIDFSKLCIFKEQEKIHEIQKNNKKYIK